MPVRAVPADIGICFLGQITFMLQSDERDESRFSQVERDFEHFRLEVSVLKTLSILMTESFFFLNFDGVRLA